MIPKRNLFATSLAHFDRLRSIQSPATVDRSKSVKGIAISNGWTWREIGALILDRPSVTPFHLGLVHGAKPVGRYARRGYRIAIDGHFSSPKALGAAPFHSLLERDLQTLLSADPRIRCYAVEPHVLTYWTPDKVGRGLWRKYTPDIAALDNLNRVIVIDAKAEYLASLPSWRDREPYIRAAYEQEHGATFVVLTEHEIRAQPRLANCQIMLRHRTESDPYCEALVRDVIHVRPVPIEEVAARSKLRGDEWLRRVFSAAMRLVLWGEATFDLSLPLSVATVLRPSA